MQCHNLIDFDSSTLCHARLFMKAEKERPKLVQFFFLNMFALNCCLEGAYTTLVLSSLI